MVTLCSRGNQLQDIFEINPIRRCTVDYWDAGKTRLLMIILITIIPVRLNCKQVKQNVHQRCGSSWDQGYADYSNGVIASAQCCHNLMFCNLYKMVSSLILNICFL